MINTKIVESFFQNNNEKDIIEELIKVSNPKPFENTIFI